MRVSIEQVNQSMLQVNAIKLSINTFFL